MRKFLLIIMISAQIILSINCQTFLRNLNEIEQSKNEFTEERSKNKSSVPVQQPREEVDRTYSDYKQPKQEDFSNYESGSDLDGEQKLQEDDSYTHLGECKLHQIKLQLQQPLQWIEIYSSRIEQNMNKIQDIIIYDLNDVFQKIEENRASMYKSNLTELKDILDEIKNLNEDIRTQNFQMIEILNEDY